MPNKALSTPWGCGGARESGLESGHVERRRDQCGRGVGGRKQFREQGVCGDRGENFPGHRGVKLAHDRPLGAHPFRVRAGEADPIERRGAFAEAEQLQLFAAHHIGASVRETEAGNEGNIFDVRRGRERAV
jgi:hypothetical protein